MNDLLIGCPVYKRAWILRQWFDHVLVACEKARVAPTFAFVGAEGDASTEEAIQTSGVTVVSHKLVAGSHESERTWCPPRYRMMVELRNHLLTSVREARPSYFLSLDSDILLHPDALDNMLNGLVDERGFDAIGGKAYLTPADPENPKVMDLSCPTWANINAFGGMVRSESVGLIRVGVIMAIKLMTPQAYDVDYVYDQRGEDIGWSLAAGKKGLHLGWDGRVASKHIMNLGMLDFVDERVGF